MKALSKTEAEKILRALEKSKRKYLTLEDLSRIVGLYPDQLGEYFSYFDPLASLDPSFNCRSAQGALTEYVNGLEAKPKKQRIVVGKKMAAEYTSINDFVYKKMTGAGGLVDPSASLNDIDLKILNRLVKEEIESRKPKKRTKKAVKHFSK